ncbi:GntR family transcriptional regulator [Saccharopolyspora mangrovi]|uniref:GntR family transcriptional regulator n=1 Tax=Saccharopolyspora mangrovi TaxID=3082379 RepID=A0ABU6AG33_9PSEU|nr:GntR family transcriptional regulator [Saccharopolyspora sp. S2-29]MEB3370512.1 GntR family transcriptional regulator [Saccharopolyspora sp. S2-29]
MALIDGLSFQRTTTAQQLADALSARVLSGAIAPGQRMRESAIAAELGVARNTVREAVRILEIAGLVRHEVNRGAVVVSPTPEAIEELYASRVVLETAAIRCATSPDQLKHVETAYVKLVGVADSKDPNRIVSADLGFHTAIVGMLNNSRIQAFYEQLARELHFYLMHLIARDHIFDDPAVIIGDHRSIMEALRAGDLELAATEATHHLERNKARVKRLLAAIDD